MTSPTGAVEAVGGIFEAEVMITILMPNTMISVMVSGGSGGMVLASGNFTSGSSGEIPEGEILVSEITSNSAFLRWKEYQLEPYTLMTSPTGAVVAVGDLLEPEVRITILMPDTMISVMIGGRDGGMVLASGNFTSGQIPDGEILVSDITSDSAFLQWKDYQLAPYTLMTSPTGSVETVGDIFESEVGITILMPNTTISVMIGGRDGGMVLASGNFTSGQIPEGEILVSDITSDSAFLQWQDYQLAPYTLMTSPTGAVEAVGDLLEPEVRITILMPDTKISVMIGGRDGGMVLASGNFTSGSPDECSMEMPPPRCNSGFTPTQHRACLAITTLFLFYTTLLLPRHHALFA
ncbi:tenascin-R-like isoform X1 [Strongylocentrotus purpuratus]|uniref:Uncharacterized protein n=1 Tax=Strongylocentrotus purpuratus TaxID=7668 RepID=A0A7M7HJG4_STRPU|nr:tenascin-R-like isoform X1 [Strongylocentrotus purpuratus]